MKFEINDKVGVIYDGQLTQGQIIKRYKFLFWNRYWVTVNVNIWDEGRVVYTQQRALKRFEGQLITLGNDK